MFRWLKKLFAKKKKDKGGWNEEFIGIRSRQKRRKVCEEVKEWML